MASQRLDAGSSPSGRRRRSGARAAAARSLAVLALLVPYIVGFTPLPQDSAVSTSVTAAAGGGRFAHVTRDRSGRVLDVNDVPYQDVAIGVERRMPTFSVGGRAGTFHIDREIDSAVGDHSAQRSWYVNPYAGMDGRFVGGQLGIVLMDHHAEGVAAEGGMRFHMAVLPSMRLRLGHLDAWHVSTSFASNMPLGSGGGVYDFGVGFPIGGPDGSAWLGFGLTSYAEGSLPAKMDIPVLENLTLKPRLQYRRGDATEYGLSIGGTIRF